MGALSNDGSIYFQHPAPPFPEMGDDLVHLSIGEDIRLVVTERQGSEDPDDAGEKLVDTSVNIEAFDGSGNFMATLARCATPEVAFQMVPVIVGVAERMYPHHISMEKQAKEEFREEQRRRTRRAS